MADSKASVSSIIDQEIFTEFIVEAQDGIQNLERELATVSDGHLNDKQVDEVMRIMHTLKGTSGFVGLGNLSQLTHQMEDLMINLRDEVLQFNGIVVDTIFKGIDFSRRIVDRASLNPSENILTAEENFFVKRVVALNEGKGDIDEKITLNHVKERITEAKQLLDKLEIEDDEVCKQLFEQLSEFVNHIKKNQPQAEKRIPLIDEGSTKEADVYIAEEKKDEVIESEPVLTDDDEAQALKEKADKFIRVDQGKIDDLMHNIGSLIMKSDSMSHFYQLLLERRPFNDDEINSYHNNIIGLNKTIFNLEGSLMEVRKLPAKKLFNKFYYVVRNTAKKVKKQVNLKLENEDMRIDSSILNDMEPVLTHIVRNSIDHGIESPQERSFLQKPETGLVRLVASRDEENFIITIQDDGGGINVERIKEIIVKRGLRTTEELETMAEDDIFAYIFHPGFSSKEQVTDISGRGVGLDVVKTTMDKLNGQYQVHSELGVGTTFKLVIPQMSTLVTKEAVIAQAGEQKFAFLLEEVESMIYHAGDEFIRHKEKKMIKYQDDIYPVYYLSELITLSGNGQQRQHDEKLQLVLLNAESGRFGIVIDQLEKVQTIVIKEFEYEKMSALNSFGGYTITGSGDVVLVIDGNGIVADVAVSPESEQNVIEQNDEE